MLVVWRTTGRCCRSAIWPGCPAKSFAQVAHGLMHSERPAGPGQLSREGGASKRWFWLRLVTVPGHRRPAGSAIVH